MGMKIPRVDSEAILAAADALDPNDHSADAKLTRLVAQSITEHRESEAVRSVIDADRQAGN